jgi:hypothetical protein
MNNYTTAIDISPQLFFTYKEETKAIYVVPYKSANYGYILPIPNQNLSSNSYTFIYNQKRSCEMFIAPISQRKYYSKTFVSYNKYNKKLQNYIRRIRSDKEGGVGGNADSNPDSRLRSNKESDIQSQMTSPLKFPRIPANYVPRNTSHSLDQSISINQTQSCSDLGSISKMMQIFDVAPEIESIDWSIPIPENDFKPVETLDNSFFGTSPDDFVDDFVFND